MGLFDNAISKGRCPACGSQVEKPLRWFKTVRELLGPLAIAPGERDGGGKPAADGGATGEEGGD